MVIFQELLVCLLKAAEKAACIARACRSVCSIVKKKFNLDLDIIFVCR